MTRAIAFVVLIAFMLIALPITMFAVSQSLSGPQLLALLISLITAPWIAAPALMRLRMRRPLRSILRSEGVPICLKCGYDTTGVTSASCPECGDDLDRQAIEAMVDMHPSQLEPIRREALRRVVNESLDPLRPLTYDELRARVPSREEREVAYGELRSCAVEIRIESGDDDTGQRVVVMATASDHPPRSLVPLVESGAFVRVSATRASGSDDAVRV